MDHTPLPSSDPPSAAAVRFGPFVLEAAPGRLLRDGQVVDLGSKPLCLLAFLAARPGVLMSKEALLEGVWGHLHVSDSALKVAINSLRQALCEDARAPRWIHTEPRRGYRFSNEAAAVDAAATAVPASASKADAPRGNLPAPAGALLGRDAAIAELQAALATHRLVTITGSGGVGKTRLALAVAGHDPPPDGVWLLRLETLPINGELDAVLVPALARTLGLSEAAGRDTAALARALGMMRVRLVLDNGEHVADALAQAVTAWLQAAPGLQILVTSQRPLRLSTEQVLPLPPLAPSPAITLLVQRAQRAMPQWVPNAVELADLEAIAQGLDMLPLALELAAARVPLLGTAGVRQRLDARLQMLTRGAHDAPSRHRTLRAALEWSVALLPLPVARLLYLCSVFAGGFTLTALQHLAARTLPHHDEMAVLDGMQELLDLGLVVKADSPHQWHGARPNRAGAGPALPAGGTAPRYRLYDSVALFCRERLAERGEEQAAQMAHIAWTTQVFGFAHETVSATSEADWLAPIEPEAENLLLAMQRALAAAGQDATQLPALLSLICVVPVFCFRAGLKRQLLGWWKQVQERLLTDDAHAVAQAFQVPLDTAHGLMAAAGQLLPPVAGLAALERALAAGGARFPPDLHRFLVYLVGCLQQRLNLYDGLEGTQHRLAALLRTHSTLYSRRSLAWLAMSVAKGRGDLRPYRDFYAQMLADSRRLGDHLEAWRGASGLGQSLYLDEQLDAAIDTLDGVVDEIRVAGRQHGFSAVLAQGAMLRLARDASPDTLSRVSEAVRVLRADDMVWWLADALAWVPLWQGRIADALRVQAWADGLVAARKEQRGPVFTKLRKAFEDRTAGHAWPDGPPLDEASALTLALGPGAVTETPN